MTGWAQETKGSSPVNKTSWVENCETSAIGRALANLGYAPKASEGARPSREEMSKVDGWADDSIPKARPIQDHPLPEPQQVNANEIQRERIIRLVHDKGVDLPAMLNMAGFDSLSSVPQERAAKLITWLENHPDRHDADTPTR